MPDETPWTGVTHRDDLHATGADDGGEPTAAMPPVRHDPVAAAPPVAAVPGSAPRPSADEDEVPFWLLPAPARPAGPTVDRPQQVPRPPTLSPSRSGRRAVPPPAVPDVPDERPPLADQVFAGAGRGETRVVEIDGTGSGPWSPYAPPVRSARTRSARAASTGPAAPLLDRVTAAVAPVVDRVVDRARTLPPGWLVGVVAAAVALVVVLVSLTALGGGDEPTGQKPTPTVSVTPARIDAALVTASASSTQDRAGRTTYDAANTLDGKPSTAWNSDGAQDGPGPGITLTYGFDRPVDLRTITVTNGYQKTVTSDGEKVDLFAANSRLKRVTIVTDAGRWTWDLKDTKAPQPFRRDFGTTSTVTIEIVSVHEGSRYTDVGVSDVAFGGVVQKG